MPTYAYRAVDDRGAPVRGESFASTEACLQAALEDRGLLLIRARERSSSGATMRGNRARNIERFTSSVASLLAAGLPIGKALRAAGAIEAGPVRAAASELSARLERGESISVAMSAYPRLFSSSYVGHVRAGDVGRDLTGAFQHLAVQLESERAFRQRLISASLYPVVLLVTSMGATGLLLGFVLPRFARLLHDTGAALPGSTRVLLGAAEMTRAAFPWGLLLLLALSAAVSARLRTMHGRIRLVALIRRIPLIGMVQCEAAAARFARILSGLLDSGLPLLPALKATADAVADPLIQRNVNTIREMVRDGASLHGAIVATGGFPPVVSQLVQIGEEASQVAPFLRKTADLLEQRVQQHLARAVAILEPAIVVGFGGIVGFVAIALLQAVYSVNAGAF